MISSVNVTKFAGFCGFGHIYHLHLLHLPLRISSLNVTKIYQLHLLKNSLMENFIFCAVKLRVNRYPERRIYFYKSYQNILKQALTLLMNGNFWKSMPSYLGNNSTDNKCIRQILRPKSHGKPQQASATNSHGEQPF